MSSDRAVEPPVGAPRRRETSIGGRRGGIEVAPMDDVNYRFFADLITGLPNAGQLRVLDYGCGQGTLIKLLRDRGIACSGLDVFYEGADFNEVRSTDLFREGLIRAVPEGEELPFPPCTFDVIVSNQVFEHVDDKMAVLRRLKRVLRDDGFMYHHFPSREVLREGHIGMPLVHWLPKGRFRRLYTLVLRGLGFGYFKNGESITVWTDRKLEWVDRYCFYEPYGDLLRALSEEFVVTHHEIAYCRYRARGRALLERLLAIEALRGVHEAIFRRLAFMAIRLEKRLA